jgi:hypothetical protein
VSTSLTTGLPILPHGATRNAHADLYEAEATAAGPAGTVLAYRVRRCTGPPT